MESPTPERILSVGLGFWASRTLLTAVELKLFGALAQSPADLEALRQKLGLHERSARDFFDALVALKLLERDDGIYRNTVETDFFLDPAKPSYIGGIMEMAGSRLYGHWNSLTEALRTGKFQSEGKDSSDIFGSLYSDPERLRGFLSAMTGVSAGAAQAIATKFPWTEYRTFVDVGAAQGIVPVTLAQSHPHLTGTGFDLPPVRPMFEEFVQRRGVSDRVRFYAGDFFKDDLPTADVIILGHILHDWDLTQKKALLGKVFATLPEGGAIIVYDAMIDDDRRENAIGLLMSLNMLIETPGGFDYTGADCQEWLRGAGFSNTRIEHLVGPDSMVVGIK